MLFQNLCDHATFTVLQDHFLTDGDPVSAREPLVAKLLHIAMTTSRCSHLPEVLPDGPGSAAPAGKSASGGPGPGPAGGRPHYVMQVSAKDGQLLSTVVRTLATHRLDVLARTCMQSITAQLHTTPMFSDGCKSSSPFNDRPMCRICHEGSSQEDLLSPCECTGTLGTIHRSCLEHWLSSSNTSYCELCHFRFAVERKPRPLVEWLRNPGPQHEKRTLFGDMVCFLFITPLATISGWLCLRGAVDHLHFSSRLEAVGLIALTVALFTIYLFWTLFNSSQHDGTANSPGCKRLPILRVHGKDRQDACFFML
ncbi:E3 ubiquitin-protein ligase MARCHF3-like isoform X2 [Dromaius novaehollandiae]|uniref:E3 ubiquitin-protein ligase MARCHF3-like isoform X2 n=1 Tax=Dromaius novaehollandiae TaxID=8790 RepID=UPI00311F0A6F